MPTVQRAAGAAVWYVLIAVRWAHASFVQRPVEFWLDTVLGNWEEAAKSAVRETFFFLARWLNGVSAWVVSACFDANYYSNLRAGSRRPTAWQRWWAAKSSRGTFNAVLERDGLVQGRSPSSPAPFPASVRTPHGSLQRASASYDQLLAEQQQKQIEVLLAAERLQSHAAVVDGGGGSATPRRWLSRLFGRLGALGSVGGGGSSSSLSGSWEDCSGGRGMSPKWAPTPGMRRSGSELFERPSGMAVAERMRRRGLLEDTRLTLELAVTAAFDGLRSAVRTLLLLPKHQKWSPAGSSQRCSSSLSSSLEFEFGNQGPSTSRSFGRQRRSARAGQRGGGGPSGLGGSGVGPKGQDRRGARMRSFGALEDMHVWTVSDVILTAGYPLEEHICTTSDGYILHMQRIPRRGSRDVVFFQHGVMDTSLGWVASGVQGSQAFAAWDAGFDVFLGNARSNPPRMHADPGLSGGAYWCYSLNQLGTEDIAAQIDHIHALKTRELRPGGGHATGMPSRAGEGSLAVDTERLRRSYSDSALEAMAALRPSPFDAPESPDAGSSANSRHAEGPFEGAKKQQATQQQQQQQQEQGCSAAETPRRTAGSLDGWQAANASVHRCKQRQYKQLRLHVAQPAGETPLNDRHHASTARAGGERQAGGRLFSSMFGRRRQELTAAQALSIQHDQPSAPPTAAEQPMCTTTAASSAEAGPPSAEAANLPAAAASAAVPGLSLPGLAAAVAAAASPGRASEKSHGAEGEGEQWFDTSDDVFGPRGLTACRSSSTSCSSTPGTTPYVTPRESSSDDVCKDGSGCGADVDGRAGAGAGAGCTADTSAPLSFTASCLEAGGSCGSGASQVAEGAFFKAAVPTARRPCNSMDLLQNRTALSSSSNTLSSTLSNSSSATLDAGGGWGGSSKQATAAEAAGRPSAAPLVAPRGAGFARQPSAPAGAAGRLVKAATLGPPGANVSSGSGSNSGGTLPSEPPAASLSSEQLQALTPDKISIQGVEQPGEAEAASTATLRPMPSRLASSSTATAIPPHTPGFSGSAGMEPYRLRAVGHSLGGASLLIYAVHCRRMGRPHHLRRMVLLTPAGFHAHYPKAAFPFVYLLPLVMAALSWLRPGVGIPVYIPSSLLRYATFKLSYDLQQIPALNELMRAGMRLLLSGDMSQWDRALQVCHDLRTKTCEWCDTCPTNCTHQPAVVWGELLQMPHYNTYGMPAISLHTGAHLIQLIRTRKFELFDYGSAAANQAHYGQPRPLDVAAHYSLLQGLPVDLVAGRSDGIIGEADVQSHYEAMRRAGVQVTFKSFDVGHLDVTFAVKEEIRRFVLARLQMLDGMPARPTAAAMAAFGWP